MQIAESVPAVQLDHSQPLLATFLVLGPGHADSTAGYHAGSIITVYFGPHVQSPLLVIEKAEMGGRMVGIKGLHITSTEVARGTMFLRDMYAAEGRLADYDRYVERERAIRRGMRVEPFADHDPRLPAKVVEWRKGRLERGTFVWDVAGEAASEPEPSRAPAVRRRNEAL